MDLSIISVNWRSVDYLRKCLATIHAQVRGIAYEIIIVDNGAIDDSAYILKEEFPDILLIRTRDNLGFSRANNLGFERSTGKTILFLNPDTEVVGAAIQTMLSHLSALPDGGLAGCKLLNSDHTVQTTSIQRFPTIGNQVFGVEKLRLLWPKSRLWGIKPLFTDETTPVPVEVISGACLMIQRNVFEKVGRFSEDYFMYAEDVDLCYQVHREGLRAYYIGDAIVIHHGGGSSGRTKVNQWATIMQRMAILHFLTKTRGRTYAAAYRMAMGISAVVRLGLVALLWPLKGLLFEGPVLSASFGKWVAILKWAAGLETAQQ